MKVKEKCLTDKAASARRNLINRRKFNAFALKPSSSTANANRDRGGEPIKEVYLDFLGNKLLIGKDESGNGTIKEESIPFVKRATLRFDGCGSATVTYGDIKVRFYLLSSFLLCHPSVSALPANALVQNPLAVGPFGEE